MLRRRHRLICGLGVGLVAWLSTFAVNGAFLALGGATSAAGPAPPNRFDPASRAASVAAAHLPPASTSTVTRISPSKSRPPAHLNTQPAAIALDPARPVHLATSDGAVQLDVPAGAVTARDVAAAGGAMSLRRR